MAGESAKKVTAKLKAKLSECGIEIRKEKRESGGHFSTDNTPVRVYLRKHSRTSGTQNSGIIQLRSVQFREDCYLTLYYGLGPDFWLVIPSMDVEGIQPDGDGNCQLDMLDPKYEKYKGCKGFNALKEACGVSE